MQPRAHQGHYNFKEPPGSKQQSPDQNLRVLTRPQKPKYNFRKIDRTPVQPRVHRGHYIPKEPPGSHTTSRSKYTRVPIRSQDLKEKPCTLVRPQGPITITETSGVPTTVSGSSIESPDSYITFGLQSRSQDLEKRPSGPKQRPHGQREPPGSSTTSGSPDEPRSTCNLRVTRSFSRLLESVC